LPFKENLAKSLEVYRLTEAAGVGLEAEMGAIGGVEDDKFVAEDKALLANFDECVAFCKEMPKLAVFAPAIGTAHGFYKGEPKIAYDLLKKITAAVFATPTLARQFVRQAWDTWPVDAVFPMLYHNFYQEDVDWIGRGTREGVVALKGRVPLYSGLFLPRLDPSELSRAVALSREAGASGVALFSLNSLTDARLSALARVRVARSGE
jgi:hypothetical protein